MQAVFCAFSALISCIDKLILLVAHFSLVRSGFSAFANQLLLELYLVLWLCADGINSPANYVIVFGNKD